MGVVPLVVLLGIFLAMQINALGTTTNPADLDVEGNIHASGTITSGDSITIDGDGENHTITASGGRIDFDDEDLVISGNILTEGNIVLDNVPMDKGNIVLEGGANQFDPAGSPDVLAMFRGGPPSGPGVFLFKRFGPEHTILHINSPPCASGCLEATVALVRGDEPNLELVDFYNNGYEEETQYGIRMIKRGEPEDGAAFRDFVFDYFDPDDTNTKSEVMRITPPDPSANPLIEGTVRITGYIQLDLTSGKPPKPDCDSAAEEGRMKFDPKKNRLHICSGVSGWVSNKFR